MKSADKVKSAPAKGPATKLIAIPDRRQDGAPKMTAGDGTEVTILPDNTLAVLTGDDAPLPRATDKQVRAARTKAAVKVGKSKHKPDAATIAARNVASGNSMNARQEADAKLIPDALKQQMAKDLDIPAEDVAKHVKVAPAIPSGGYQGPMLALRQRLKQGQYKKAANGQPSCGDEVAQILGALEPAEVIAACLIAMDITNPYLHLNVGQQSMNLRNKLRGKLKHGEFGMGVVREAAETVIEARPAK